MKWEFEATLCSIMNQPNTMMVINDACAKLQDRLVVHGHWPANVIVNGLVLDVLLEVYRAGELRGAARELCPVSALFPIDGKCFE